MSLPRRAWTTAEASTDAVDALTGALGVPRPVALVLAARGFGDPDAVEAFLSPRLSLLSDPLGLPGMAAGAGRILQAVEARQRISLFGDYDADGVTATALLTGVLRRLGGQVAPFIPCRFEDGYGFTDSALQRCLAEQAPELIVTVDCGTNAVASVAQAATAGVDVVVTDHHEPADELADAAAIINPELGEDAATRDLAGVGVAFKLCHALVKLARESGWPAAAGLDLRDWLDLVAIGTVADVAGLTGENRILVRHGLARLEQSSWAGVRALLKVAGVQPPLTTYHIGFMLGPRLNAAGRLASGHSAVDLLLSDDEREAADLARELDQANSERRRIEEGIRDEAGQQLDDGFDPGRDYGLVAYGEDWHVGTIGIVASRLCRRYQRPVIVLAGGGDNARGSGRSLEGLNLVETLAACAANLETFGGHELAAGLTVRRDGIDAFREAFNALCRERLEGTDLRPRQRVDAWVCLGEVDDRLEEALTRMRPFGVGNPQPVFGARGVRVVGEARRVGRDGAHLKLTLAEGATQVDAIGFGFGHCELPDGPLDVLFEVNRNTFRGYDSLQLQIKDMAPAHGA